MASWFLILFLIFFSTAKAQQFSNLFHQLLAEKPCWWVEAKEVNVLLSAIGNCRLLKPQQPVLRQTLQQILFSEAQKEYNGQALCLKRVFEQLGNSHPDSKIQQSWIDTSASILANYVYKSGRANRLRRFQQAKELQIRSLLVDPIKNRDQVRELINSPLHNYDKEAKLEQEDAEIAKLTLPFGQHPLIERAFEETVEDLFTRSPENFPQDKNEIQKRIKEALQKRSPKIFNEALKSFDKEFMVNYLTTTNKRFLLNGGYIAQVLNKNLPSDDKLKQKFQNCVAGDYGAISSGMEDLPITLAGGGVAAFGAKKAVGTGLRRFVRLPFLQTPTQFTFGALTAYSLSVLPRHAVQRCTGLLQLAEAKSPKNCESAESVNEFAIKWLEAQNCFAAALSIVI